MGKPSPFFFFLTGASETNLVKSEITRRLRLHRVAEATVTMMNADILFFRDYVFFELIYSCGLRISEALGLRYEDCDMTNGIIHVNHELLYKTGEDGKYRYRISTPKTRAGYRIVPMMDDVKTALKREMKKVRREDNKFTVDGYTGFIFLNSKGKVYTQSFVFDTLQRIRDYYNAEEAERAREEKRTPVFLPKLSAHIMRHTFCSRMCENDANLKDLQDIMGHRNIRTTMETYTKTSQNKKIETIKSMNGAFKISYP